MAAGFQCDVGRGAFCRVAGADYCIQRRRLGVRPAGLLVPALADQAAIAHDDTADTRIGGRGEQAAPRQLQRARHEGVVGR